MKVLVIGEVTTLIGRIRRDLQKAHFEVEAATGGQQGLEMAQRNRYALVVMDLALPGAEVGSLCEALRTQRHHPAIVMLTSPHNCGDIYLADNYDTPEFLAGVRLLLARPDARKTPLMQVGDLEIDSARHRVTRAGVEIDLSLREFSLLEALAINRGHILTREAIQEKVWQNEEALPKTVDVYIGRLRRRVDDGHAVKLIQTVRGLGYCLRSEEQEESAGL